MDTNSFVISTNNGISDDITTTAAWRVKLAERKDGGRFGCLKRHFDGVLQSQIYLFVKFKKQKLY